MPYYVIQLFTSAYISGYMIFPHAAVSLLFPYETCTLGVFLQLEYKTKHLIDRNTNRKVRTLSFTTYGFDKF